MKRLRPQNSSDLPRGEPSAPRNEEMVPLSLGPSGVGRATGSSVSLRVTPAAFPPYSAPTLFLPAPRTLSFLLDVF